MKRFLLFFALMTALLYTPSYCDTEADYTVMVYLNGSTLESDFDYVNEEFLGAGTKDLLEMVEGHTGKGNIKVVVETIGTKRWNNDFISNDHTQRFLIENGEIQLKDSLPHQKVGYKKGLSDFVLWSKRNYPAKKYSLILWNHGGGPVQGFGLDEHFDGESLQIDELKRSLDTISKDYEIHFEFIGFDACLMANLEIANSLSPYADYLFASEDLEPTHGWAYKEFLQALNEDTSLSTEALGKVVADSYLAQAKEKKESHNLTFSIIKLSEVGPIVQGLEQLLEDSEGIFSVNDDFYDFAKSITKSRSLGDNTDVQGYTDLIDLKDFAQRLSQKLDLNTDPIIKAIDTAVVYKIDTSKIQNAGGLSIYFPLRDQVNYEENITIYDTIGFSNDYSEFFQRFNDHITKLDGDNIIETQVDEPDDDHVFYYLTFDEDDLNKISDVYLELLTLTPDDAYPNHSFINYGFDALVGFDPRNNTYNEHYDKKWIYLNDLPLMIIIVADNELETQYISPVVYNSKEMFLIFSYNKETRHYTINGLRRSIDQETGKPDKKVYQLKPGNTLQARYSGFNERTRTFNILRSEEIILSEDIGIYRKNITPKHYIIAFRFFDYRHTMYLTDPIEFKRELPCKL
jgi:hypothetical protein